jgi:hypothetical protein
MKYCCPAMEKFAHPTEPGLGVMVVIRKWRPSFFLMYSKDWQVPVAEAGIQIQHCPFCGSKLTGASSMIESG